MFTKQPTHVVYRGSAIVFHGTESECQRFALWANREFGVSEYRTATWR